MNHYIHPIAPSRWIPIIAPRKSTGMSPQETLIAPMFKDTLLEGYLDGQGLFIDPGTGNIDPDNPGGGGIECAKHGHNGTVVKKPVKKIKASGCSGRDGKPGFTFDMASHGRKIKKKKKKTGGLEGTAVAMECIKITGCSGVIMQKPYPGDIYPRPPFPKGGTEEISLITVRVEPVDDWPYTIEGWGGGNCHEVYYGVEGHGGGINANTGGGTGCAAEGCGG